jgi:hypothetical protein
MLVFPPPFVSFKTDSLSLKLYLAQASGSMTRRMKWRWNSTVESVCQSGPKHEARLDFRQHSMFKDAILMPAQGSPAFPNLGGKTPHRSPFWITTRRKTRNLPNGWRGRRSWPEARGFRNLYRIPLPYWSMMPVKRLCFIIQSLLRDRRMTRGHDHCRSNRILDTSRMNLEPHDGEAEGSARPG